MSPTSGADLLNLLNGFLRCHFWTIIAFLLITNATWMLYVLVAPNTYLATTKIIINPRNLASPILPQNRFSDVEAERSDVQTDADILKSEEVARKVISDLRLTEIREFADPGLISAQVNLSNLLKAGSELEFLDPLRELLATSAAFVAPSEDPSMLMARTVRIFRSRLSVKPVGASRLIDVSFKSNNAERAAQIANKVADTLINMELQANAQVADKATAWSRDRLQDMRGRIDNVQTALNQQLRGANTVDSQVLLRDLEGRAQTLRKVYDKFLQNEAEAAKLGAFPIAQASVIAPAYPPFGGGGAKGPLGFAIVNVGAAFIVFALCALQDMKNRTLRTIREVEAALDLECIAMLPALKGLKESLWRPRARAIRHAMNPRDARFVEALQSIEFATGLSRVRKNTSRDDRGRFLAHSAEGGARLVGLTSALASEGKSTLAAALAYHTAKRGERVLLIDCDMRHPALTQSLHRHADKGLREVLAGASVLDDVIIKHERDGLHFLPARSIKQGETFESVLAYGTMRDVFSEIRKRYDAVFVDLPPLAPVVDARVIAELLDVHVLVVEWGKTTAEVAAQVLRNAKNINDRLVGAVLNKVDFLQLNRYDLALRPYYSDKYFYQT
jgi:capsular exopolysaccharide synthesis family protein